MSMALFGQIVLLMVIFIFLATLVKCLHDNFCVTCKKGPEGK